MTMTAKSIQIFSPFFPYPRNEGAHIVISEQARRLRELRYNIQLIYWKGATPAQEIIDREFEGISVTRLAPEAYEPTTAHRIFLSLLSPWSSAELYHYPPTLRKELAELPPADLRIFHYSFAGPWLTGPPPSSAAQKTAVVFHNFETEIYRQRTASTSRYPAKWIHHLNTKKLQKHELQLAARAEELWFLSPKDLTDFRDFEGYRQASLRLFSPFFSEAFLKEKRRLRKSNPSESTKIVGFVGGLHFRPNQVSAEWIVDQLAPELQKQGFAGRLWIAGKNPPAHLITNAKRYPFIDIQGFLPSLDEYWSRISFSLSPHIEGSGVRMKLLESLVAGVPVLTHTASLKQLNEDLKKSPQLFATDSPQEWAEIIMKESSATRPADDGDLALTSPPSWFETLFSENLASHPIK